jgi:hypothetical protein
MNRVSRIALLITAAGVIVAITPADADAPLAPASATTSTTTPTTTNAPSPTSTAPPAVMTRCPQWQAAALAAGFAPDHLPTLDHVIHRESRCDPTQLNAADPNGGSVGLTQINRFWCLPSRYYPDGYLQTVGVLDDCAQLFNPAVNLSAALALVDYSRAAGLCEWSQWAWVNRPCHQIPD